MFQDQKEELQRLQSQLMQEPEEMPLPEADAPIEPEEDMPLEQQSTAQPSNRWLLIAACALCLGILGVLAYVLIRFGGFFL